MPAATIASFVNGLLQSELLDDEQRAEVTRLQTKAGDLRELAQELLKRDWLTAYQVNQISQGKGAGLTIGPFILLERIGEGGMGQVFKARQKMLNRVVALKVIRKQCLDNPKVILRFQREIRAAGQLSHPHIVRAFDADQVNGTYYIAMEFIDGADLAKIVHDHGPLPVDQACEYIRQAALGLQHAHERGMVHRDIKPANLLVTRAVASDRRRSSGVIRRPLDLKHSSTLMLRAECYPWGVIKILDMGLARCTGAFAGPVPTNLTLVGSVMGTPEYIAPEQARDSHSSDIRADLYSLGCTLYYLLTGQPPFPNGTLTEKLMQHQIDEAPPVVEVRRENMKAGASRDMVRVPSAVDQLIRRLLAKHPDDRWQTPAELANELQAILQQLATGTLMDEELADTQALLPVGAVMEEKPAESVTTVEPLVLLHPKLARWGILAGRFAVVSAALSAAVVISIVTVVAVLMTVNTHTRANTKYLEGTKSLKEPRTK